MTARFSTLQNSAIFSKYPKLQADHEVVHLICDTLRAGSMNYDDPHQVEEVLEKRIEAEHHHALHASHALQTIADGLPALVFLCPFQNCLKIPQNCIKRNYETVLRYFKPNLRHIFIT